MTNTGTGQDRPLAGSGLLRALAENWLLLLRGIAALAFAAVAFAWPHLTLFTLTFLWGAYALSDGIFALWAAGIRRGRRAGAALVAGRRGNRQHSGRAADVLLARHDRPASDDLHRRLGD